MNVCDCEISPGKLGVCEVCVDIAEHRPMVTNPIYEGGALYEEIPANAPPLPPDRDCSYITLAAKPTNEVCEVSNSNWLSSLVQLTLLVQLISPYHV